MAQHRQVIGTNNSYKFLLLEAVCYCSIFVLMKATVHRYTKFGRKKTSKL